MLLILILAQLILCLFVLYREVARLKFINFATAIFFLIYTIVFVVEPLVLHLYFGGAKSIVVGAPDYFADNRIYYILNGYGFLLLLVAIAFRSVFDRPRSTLSPAMPIVRPHSSENTGLAIVVILGFFLWLYATGMDLSDLIYASRFSWFLEVAFSIFWLNVAGYLMAVLSAYVFNVTLSQKPWSVLFLAALGTSVLHGLISKDRKWVIFIISGWVAARYELSGRRLVISNVTLAWLSVVFVLMVASGGLRDVLFRYWMSENVNAADEFERWNLALIEYGDISYFYRASLEAIHQNLNRDLLVPFALLRRNLLFFLPAAYSGGLKVEDISATFSDVVHGEDAMRRGNMPPGFFGLFVISFGWLATFAAIPLIPIALKGLDALFRFGQGTLRQVILSMFLFSVVLAFRGDDSSAIYYVISTAMIVAVLKLIGLRQSDSAARLRVSHARLAAGWQAAEGGAERTSGRFLEAPSNRRPGRLK